MIISYEDTIGLPNDTLLADTFKDGAFDMGSKQISATKGD